MKILRFGFAVLTGAAITFGLLFLMQLLIKTGKSDLDKDTERHMVDFVRVKREETVERKKPKPKKPPKPEAPPPDMPAPSRTMSLDASAEPISIPDVPVNVQEVHVSNTMGIGFGLGTSDGDFLPIVKVKPIYPIAALNRGIEGYVIIEFTVTKTGSVKDPVVVEYDPSPIFNKAALDAALKFKYKPRVINGEAIEVAGVRNKITFKIEN